MEDLQARSILTMAEQLQMIVVNAAVCALLVSLFLLWLYLRAVKRSMRERGGEAAIETASVQEGVAVAPPASPLTIIEANPGTPLSEPAKRLAEEALGGRWRAAAVYVFAGLVFALVSAAIYLAFPQTEAVSFGRFLYLTLVNTWPALLAICFAVALSWLPWAVLIVLIIGATTMSEVIAQNGTGHAPGLDETVLTANVMGLILLGLFLMPRIRAVGPIVYILSFAFAGALMVNFNLVDFSVFGTAEERRLAFDPLAKLLGLSDHQVFLLTGIAGVVVIMSLCWLVLRGLGSLYASGRLSDQDIIAGSVFLMAALQHSVVLATAGALWFVAPLAAYAAYRFSAIAGFAYIKRWWQPEAQAPRLLLLRVFSLGKRSKRLFDAFAKVWRYGGPIRMIAGPDLATTTVEPHEFLEFMSGQLSRRFISGPKALEHRIGESPLHRDHDGRFRVSEFFCHDDTWKMVLSRLASDSDVVLMDLRDFTKANTGCIYELNELLAVVPLGRIVLVVDSGTDLQFLKDTLQRGWVAIPASSPNRKVQNPVLALHGITGQGSIPALVRAVASAARGS